MLQPLLTTKLFIPPLRAGRVRREHLLDQIDQGLDHKLTLISAPAGFGKTTLLSEWANRHPQQVGWISLDKDDNDPVRWLVYLVSALQNVNADIGEGILDSLNSLQAPSLLILLTGLVNQINTLSLNGESVFSRDRLVLLFDDYHVIVSKEIHQALAFLLDNLPPQLHVIISTRADPPLPIARLRANGQLNELRQQELVFNSSEASAFLNQTMGLNLGRDDAIALARRTEGWIAGLQLAAVSLKGQSSDHASQFIHDFSGSDRYILDYLVEEVLFRQPEHIQSFLLKTSILERLTATLCDAVVGQENSQENLESLERENLFLIPLDNQREWYRYHHLFAHLLLQRLQQLHPESLPVLHQRAHEWFEERGLREAAIDHALSAGDAEHAADLMEQIADSVMLRSEVATLQGWVSSLPNHILRERPQLSVYHALALLLSGRPFDRSNALLKNALEADSKESVSGEVMAFKALLATYQGDTQKSAEFSSRALELLPEDRVFFRTFVTGFIGLAYLYQGDIKTARPAFEESFRIGTSTGNYNIAVLALCHLAELAAIEYQFEKAKSLYKQAVDLSTDKEGRIRPIAGIALIGLGRIEYEHNHLSLSVEQLEKGIELVNRWGQVGTISGYLGLAFAHRALGNNKEADAAILEAERIAQKFDAMELDDAYVGANKIRLWVAQGEQDSARLDRAWQWAEERGYVPIAKLHALENDIRHCGFTLALEFHALCHVLLARNLPDDALWVSHLLLKRAQEMDWKLFVVWAYLVQALAHQQKKEMENAINLVEKALTISEPEHLFRAFLDIGRPMASLLKQAVSRGNMPSITGEILAEFDTEEGQTGKNSRTSLPVLNPAIKDGEPPVQELTDREREVLRLLATHLSSNEIAHQLFIAVSTVRSHTKSIYAKLGVHGRLEAIARAEELHLL